ncbi:MAG: hypothetical protein KO202_05555 [Methanobacteriaceae archaeon]|jgi:hypothetical protein|nr:hypothetical protein [Methanobacteriaceae archaeon]
MDKKGILTIDFTFTVMFILIISLFFLNMGLNNIEISNNLEENIESRMILDKIANSINQVNANGESYSKKITIPSEISNERFEIIVSNRNITIETNNKGSTTIFPILLIDNDEIAIYEKKLFSGRDYLISKNNKSEIKIMEC